MPSVVFRLAISKSSIDPWLKQNHPKLRMTSHVPLNRCHVLCSKRFLRAESIFYRRIAKVML